MTIFFIHDSIQISIVSSRCLLVCYLEANQKPTILVTGGGGYIGSHTIVEMLNHNYSIIVIDNLSNCFAFNATEKPESLKRVEKLTKKKVTFHNIDIRNKEGLDELFKMVSMILTCLCSSKW